ISAKGISVSDNRIKAIRDLPTPKSIKDLRSVLGMANFVRRFVKDYSDLTAPLVELTRKSFVKCASFKKAWGREQDTAFQNLKDALSSAPVRTLYSQAFHSGNGHRYGAVLTITGQTVMLGKE
ncbi:unnamed protein product, partial [Ectocarpus sp. 12 AP-2014]